MGRGIKRHRTAIAARLGRDTARTAALLALAACASVPTGSDPGQTDLHTTLEPRATAWLVAETARQCFPAADPIPQHGHAPVWRAEGDAFRIEFARAEPHDYRVAMNGRLSPPPFARMEPPFSMRGVEFHPTSQESGTRGGSDAVEIYIEPAGRGTAVAIELDGAARGAGLIAQLRAALRLAEALEQSGTFLREGRPAEAEQLATMTLQDVGTVGAQPHRRLRARLRLHRGIALAERGALGDARQVAGEALAEDPHCHLGRALRAQWDARLGHDRELAGQLQMLAVAPGPSHLARAAAQQLQQAVARHTAADRIKALRAQAEVWLARGDAEAAHRYIQRAFALGPPAAETLDVLAAIYRTLDRRRDARDTAIMEFEVHGFRPRLVLDLHDDYVALGRADVAMRWLTRYWDGLQGVHQPHAHERLVATSALIGSDRALRVLRSEHFDHFADVAQIGTETKHESPWLTELERLRSTPQAARPDR